MRIALFTSIICFFNFFIPRVLAGEQIAIKYETSERWRLISPDLQTFTLFEDRVDSDAYYSVGFYRGERQVKITPSKKEVWQGWRTKFANLIESLPSPRACQAPHRLVVEKKNQPRREKEFCFSELTNSEKTLLEQLAKDLEKSIYGS